MQVMWKKKKIIRALKTRSQAQRVVFMQKKQNSPPLPDAMYLSPNCLPNWECDLSHFVCCIVMPSPKIAWWISTYRHFYPFFSLSLPVKNVEWD